MTPEKLKLIPALGERDFEFTRYFYILSDGIIPCKLNDRRTYSRGVVEAFVEHYGAHPMFTHHFAQALEEGETVPYIRQHMLTLSDRMVVRCLESEDVVNFSLSLYYDGDQTALQEYLTVIEPYVV